MNKISFTSFLLLAAVFSTAYAGEIKEYNLGNGITAQIQEAKFNSENKGGQISQVGCAPRTNNFE